ncbi:MAG: hypothetical protein R3245_12490, partial [Kiloniellales bacterium]|nr:hypothetical protein [Kiloniellales bacterium]
MALNGRSINLLLLTLAWVLVLATLAATVIYVYSPLAPAPQNHPPKAQTHIPASTEPPRSDANAEAATGEKEPEPVPVETGSAEAPENTQTKSAEPPAPILQPDKKAQQANTGDLTENERNRPWRRYAGAFD